LLIPVICGAQPISRQELIDKYCATCHNVHVKAGKLELDSIPKTDVATLPEVWDKVARKVRSGEMPPPGAPNPGKDALRALATGLFTELDSAARKEPFVGRPVVRRLNRTEYANAIRDVLAIELPVASELPQDEVAAGFDNIADALSISPLLLERYLEVARRVSELATGTSEATAVTEIYPATATQAAWQEGMPFGTRGGIRVNHFFPRDGEYHLRAFLAKESLTPVEGVRFFRTPVKLAAGPHTVVVTFPDEFAVREGPVFDVSGPGGNALGGPLDVLGTAIRPAIDFRIDGRRVKRFEIAGMTAGEAAFDGQPGPPTLARIEITGPFAPGGAGETPSRRRIFVCKPANPPGELDCASRILATIARRAFRRDVSSADLHPFLATFSVARNKAAFEASIAAAIRDILVAPDFLFRLEFDPMGSAPRAIHPVTGFELASRLSFFLWSTIPDDALLDVARSGRLREPAVLESQVRRMAADPRGTALADNFATQWLGLRGLPEVEPDRAVFPEFDSALAAAFQTETRMFVQSILREGRSVLDLLGADYTYMNERLARHYGVSGVTGSGFRRTSLTGNPQRGGLLTQGSVLLLTSHPARTSPVLRGKWILDNLLNSPPPPPPATVPTLEESTKNLANLTTRERTEKHRANPTCAACHSRIDPLGFGLENFDVIGRWRTHDDGSEVNAAGTMPNGKPFHGPQGLKKAILEDPHEFVRGTTERLLTYALGRQLEARDQPTVRAILRETEAGGYRFHDLVMAIVRSAPFQMRQTQERY
jgi:hypothetical protein